MPKIEVNKVAEILKRNELEPSLLRQIVEELNMVAQPEADEEKPPPVKKQWVILVSDPDKKLPEHDFAGWVLQIPENESVASTVERLCKGTYEFHTTKRGRLKPCETIGEAIENVPAKHFKEAQVWVKTKEPVLMLRTDNEIPTEETDKDTRRGKVE
ncbi:MAG TPA: hypothetical protein VGD81_08675 [Opitutaceae bacterium]